MTTRSVLLTKEPFGGWARRFLNRKYKEMLPVYPFLPFPMDVAFAEAEAAFTRGEVPVGAVIIEVGSGRLLARAGNRTREWLDPTAHAEMLAIRAATTACSVPRLPACDLYVTLEPCPMCAAAIAFARIRRLYFGAYDPKGGAVEHGPRLFDRPFCSYRPELYGGLQESRAATLLRQFFMNCR